MNGRNRRKRWTGLRWLTLGSLTLPLLFQGGCSFGSPPGSPVTPINDNAYTCGCTCDEGPRTVSIAVAASSDDSEQSGTAMQLNGLDLDMGPDPVGIRFNAVSIPPGVTVRDAYVQFTADETNSVGTNLTIVAEYSPNAPTFTTAPNNLGGRSSGSVSINWSPGPWTLGAAGPNQRTPNLKDLIRELVDQPGWSVTSPVVPVSASMPVDPPDVVDPGELVADVVPVEVDVPDALLPSPVSSAA